MLIGLSLGLTASRSSTPAVFDPATLSLSGWWRASYSGSPWTPTASAGTSGANGNLTEATNPPATGAAVNGLTPADFDGTNDILNGTAPSNLYAAAAYTIVVLFYADAASADGAVFLNPYLFGELTGSGAPVCSFSDAGVRAGHHDGAWKSVAVACATGGWHMAFVRYGGTNIEVGVDAGALSSGAAGNVSALSGTTVLGREIAGDFFNGKILEVMTASTALSDGDRSNIRDYFNDRYGLAL